MPASTLVGVTQDNRGGIQHLRCSDEDRELVAQLLNNAYADGRLDIDEHSERMTTAYNAKTFGELDVLTTDLIPQAPSRHASPQGFAAGSHQAVPRPDMTPVPIDAFRGGKAILSDFKPSGPLVMPAVSEVTSVLGNARLDLSDATFSSPETTIRLNNYLGDVRIKVAAHVRVINNISNVMGEYKEEGMVLDPTHVVIRLEGTCMLGSIKVLGPDTKLRKYEKFI